jgi:diguanylate cyclase (GGDEF)-like protein
MGLLLTSFAVMLLLMGRENNRWITGSIRLRIEQATLNDDLQRMASDLERDVSERTQAEIALQEREAELREAQRVAHVGDWGWLPEANKTEWSEELYRIFGRDPGLPAPSVQEHAHFMTSESFARMKTAIAACRDTGAPSEIDLELVRPDGAAAWISARGEAQRDADGRITRIRGTAQDITARTHAEQNIAKLHEKMAEHVNALRRHEQDMTAIAKLSDILQSCHSTAEAYPIIVTTASNLFRETNGALALTAGGTHELETVAQWGANQTMLPEFSFDDCWALRTGQRHEVSGPGSGTECRHFKSAPRGSYVCLPLTVHGETSGLLHLNVAADRVVDEDLRWQMLAFGDVVKLSLSNLELRETLSKQAMRDQLTTLFNRHYLAETLPREIYRAQRNHMTLCLSMLDIDHFKVFNDAYGHDAGDVILRELGALLGGSLRASDIACRYGGEEFLLVLPDCDLNGARARLRQIRLEIKRKTIVFHGQALPSVTMSVGLAQLGGDLASADALITAADEALYAAKRNGRDRIEIFRSQIRQTAPMLPSAQPALPHAVVK